MSDNSLNDTKTAENAANQAEIPEIQVGGNLKHRGRASQVLIYLGKLFRMLIFQNDWKVFPMAAIIAGLVCFVVGRNLFKTQEGTMMGTFALACICIWNGFFNSIQVICRERPIIKREHRSGMHISSYVAAHMIYQAFLCLCQTIITLFVCKLSGVCFPEKSLLTGMPVLEIGISLFLITYCSDMLALMISALVHSTTTAMTIMPFLLIFQLVFSGAFFQLEGIAVSITNFTISKWGLTAMCVQGDYNSLPMVTLWNTMAKFQNLEVQGSKPINDFMIKASQNGMQDQILTWSGQNNQNSLYEFNPDKVFLCWGCLLAFTLLYALIAVIALEFIDRDKR